jgi:hypothetical protein
MAVRLLKAVPEQGYAFGAQTVRAAKTQAAAPPGGGGAGGGVGRKAPRARAPGIGGRARLIWRCSGNYGQ